MEILPNLDSKLSSDSFNNLPYMKACIKESLRIQPPIAGTQRAAGKNIVLSGYQIPKDVRFYKLRVEEIKYN